jgi:ABC-type Fe3+-hydroxamate transport system substrate-binding protein
MPIFYDQLNRAVHLSHFPKRIISLVPSQTELLFYLGLDTEIIGITKFCTHPQEKAKSKTKIGGTKQLDIKLIKELHPDLIIANKEENEQSQVEELGSVCPIWVSDVENLAGAISMIASIGEMTGHKTQARALCDEISLRFNQLPPVVTKPRVAYVIWRKPYMVAGNGTFIDDMLQKCGVVNAFSRGRYPEVDADMLTKIQPDVVLLSSEPYPFKNKHVAEFKTILPQARIILVDGEMFSWYGSRLLQAPGYFLSLIKSLT